MNGGRHPLRNWRCLKYKICKGRAVLEHPNFVEMTVPHNHSPNSNSWTATPWSKI